MKLCRKYLNTNKWTVVKHIIGGGTAICIEPKESFDWIGSKKLFLVPYTSEGQAFMKLCHKYLNKQHWMFDKYRRVDGTAVYPRERRG